jgi:predicted alpha/beta superfamily hydrolase
MIKIMISFLLISISFSGLLNAEEVVIGQSKTIESKVLNETRKIMVSLPKDYEKNDFSYPVLYFSDAEVHFDTMASTVHFLTKNNVIPPVIVVGIVSGSTRTRDLTPNLSKEEQEKKSWYSEQNPGGADKFITFLGQELIPYISKEYRTADFRIFSGHSLGGLFSVYTYFTQPDLFDGYMAISSSLWWDNERLVTDAKHLVKNKKLLHKYLFLSKGDEKGAIESGYKTLVSLLESYNKEGTFSKDFPDENHLTVVFNAHYYGLKAIFNEWDLPFEEGAKGIEIVKEHNKKVKNTFKVNFTSEGWLMNLGNSELYKKNYDNAIEAFEYNTRLFPNYAYSYYLLAKAYEEKKEFNLALKNYKLANDLVPETSPYKQNYLDGLEKVKGFL